jgi:chromosome segregation ATPase
LDDELKGWNDWADKRLTQLTDKLRKFQAQSKLVKEKSENHRKERKALEEKLMEDIRKFEDAPEDNKRKLGNFSSSILILEKKMSFLEKVCKDAEKAGCQLVQEEHEINERLASLPPLKASVNQQLAIMNKELSDAQEERKQFDLNSPYWVC